MKFLVNKNESVDVFFLVLNDYVKWPLKFIQVSVFLFNVAKREKQNYRESCYQFAYRAYNKKKL